MNCRQCGRKITIREVVYGVRVTDHIGSDPTPENASHGDTGCVHCCQEDGTVMRLEDLIVDHQRNSVQKCSNGEGCCTYSGSPAPPPVPPQKHPIRKLPCRFHDLALGEYFKWNSAVFRKVHPSGPGTAYAGEGEIVDPAHNWEGAPWEVGDVMDFYPYNIVQPVSQKEQKALAISGSVLVHSNTLPTAPIT